MTQSAAISATHRANAGIPAPVMWSLRGQRSGAVLLTIPVVPGCPGFSEAAARRTAVVQARRHAAGGEPVLVLSGEAELYLFNRRGCRVHCAGCRRWTAPGKGSRKPFCGRCSKARAERAAKRRAARAEAARQQLSLSLEEPSNG